jgi:hypothetical protein
MKIFKFALMLATNVVMDYQTRYFELKLKLFLSVFQFNMIAGAGNVRPDYFNSVSTTAVSCSVTFLPLPLL